MKIQEQSFEEISLAPSQIAITFQKMAECSLNFSFTTSHFNKLINKKNDTLRQTHVKKLSSGHIARKNISTQKEQSKSVQDKEPNKIFKRMLYKTHYKPKQLNNNQFSSTFRQLSTRKNNQNDSTIRYHTHTNQPQPKLSNYRINTVQDYSLKILKPQIVKDQIQSGNKLSILMNNSNKLIRQEKNIRRYSKSSKKSSISSHPQSNNNFTLKHKNTSKIVREQNFLKEIEHYICDNDIRNRLKLFSRSYEKSSNIRVYKEDYRQLFINRYGKDRVTLFLDIQFITDFDQIKKILLEIMKFTRQEALMLVFLVLDQNKDGLITAEDLSSISNPNKHQVSTNLLILNDVNKILEYVKYHKGKGDLIMDPLYYESAVVDDQLTLMKFRIFLFQQRKKQEHSQKEKAQSSVSRRLADHLFSLRKNDNHKKEEDQKPFSLQSLLKFSQKIGQSQSIYNFSINFQRFSKIFETVPHIFIDILYILGGLTLPGYQYYPIDLSILRPNTSNNKKSIVRNENKLQKCMERLNILKEQKKNFKIIKW